MNELKYEIKDGKYKVTNDEKGQYKIIQLNTTNSEDINGLCNRYLMLLSYEQDLKYANQYLVQMFFGENNSTTLIDGALINSSIQLLIKCFTNPSGKGRPGMDAKKVFEKYAMETGKKSYLKQYNQFYAARTKVLAHDQDTYLESMIGLTLDTIKCQPVEVAWISVRTRYLYKQNADILKEMLEIVLDYIKEQKEQIEKKILEYYGSKTFSEILSHEEMQVQDIEFSNYW